MTKPVRHCTEPPKPKPAPKKRGRKSTYTDEVGKQLCEYLEDGMSLPEISRIAGMPKPSTVMEWLRSNPNFAQQYAPARQRGYDVRAEAIVDRAKKAKDSGLARVAFEAERWYLGKMAPKKYGDKIQAEVELTTREMTDEQLDERLKRLIGGVAVDAVARGSDQS